MSNTVSVEKREKIIEALLARRSIKGVVRDLKVGRNTVRRIMASEGIELCPIVLPPSAPSPDKNKNWALDFSFLEKLFEQSKKCGENLKFQEHISKLASSIAEELGVRGSAIDQLRLETAISEYLNYRRYFFCSLKASDASYAGPFAKTHEKLVKATLGWTAASQKSLEVCNRILRDLEVKYRKRFPSFGSGNCFISNPNINLGGAQR